MTNKPTWRDLHEGDQRDIKRVYKLNERQLENSVRDHLDGANAKERRNIYAQFYQRREK